MLKRCTYRDCQRLLALPPSGRFSGRCAEHEEATSRRDSVETFLRRRRRKSRT